MASSRKGSPKRVRQRKARPQRLTARESRSGVSIELSQGVVNEVATQLAKASPRPGRSGRVETKGQRTVSLTLSQGVVDEVKDLLEEAEDTSRHVRVQRMSAKGRRTLVNILLSQTVVDDVDTLLWLRVTAAEKSVEAIRGGKNQIYDEAVEVFLHQLEPRACTFCLREPSPDGEWRTLWVSTPLMNRCKRIARREKVSEGRLVGEALMTFLEATVQASWRAFRKDVAAQARGMLGARSGALGVAS